LSGGFGSLIKGHVEEFSENVPFTDALMLVVLAWSVWESAAETNLATEAAGVVAMANNPGITNAVSATKRPR